MDHSSQAEVIPSESLHDILQCQLDQEDSEQRDILQSELETSEETSEEKERGGDPSDELILCQKSQRGEMSGRAKQSTWSQTCSKHHSVRIDTSRRSEVRRSDAKKLTLVRGSSLSLVDLPTFLPSSVRLGKLANISNLIQNIPIHRQLQQVARREGRSGLPISDKTMGKRSQWTVMCVALGFFSSCLILVGLMLSITSEYQDQTIARMLNISLEDIQKG